MRLHIIARGKIGRSPEAELVDRYLKRLTWPHKLTELPDRGGNTPPVERNCRTVLLDEKGEQISSSELAKMLERWRDEGVAEVRFCLGAADGHELVYRGEVVDGARDARRTTLSRDIYPCQPPLSSRRIG